ncbi:MAG: ribonuclease Z [Alphaproteobacteria bacterium]
MSTRFHPQLINDPFGDPGLYVEFMFEKRAILFDLGELTALPSRKLLRVREVFVSHMHLDHFCGFDRLLRVLLGRNHTLRFFGPEGLVDAVSHKLAAYTWNLVGNYATDLTLVVSELSGNNQLRTVEFHCRTGFCGQGERLETLEMDRLLTEKSFCVRTAVLDHGIPCLAFALEERVHVNIWKNRLEDLGLRVGPWLKDLKEAILRGDPDNTPIQAEWKEDGRVVERTLPLGELRGEAAIVTPGVKIAYVVDAVGSPDNIEKIVALAEDATVLYIESAFLHEDESLARERHHLTARQAGDIARAAGAQRFVTLHYSPRYEGRSEELMREAETAFRTCGEGQG